MKTPQRGVSFLVWAGRYRRPLGLALLLVGILTVGFPSLYKRANSPSLSGPNGSFGQKVSEGQRRVLNEPIKIDKKLLGFTEPSEPPSRVIIPRLNVDLGIVEARVVDGFWELSETSASHGVGSANPGENGNVVVFAHARQGLFLGLKEIREDDYIYLLTKDHWFRYRVVKITFVTPKQTQLVSPTSQQTLTLFTCSGFLDDKRLIVVAKPD